ncbi:MAG: hypothetical protein VKQ33_13190 [Candidatus Sericytochromatia bacterium]|nr:hypothetical protein [Candidatus Sericytochromatia bacterium]
MTRFHSWWALAGRTEATQRTSTGCVEDSADKPASQSPAGFFNLIKVDLGIRNDQGKKQAHIRATIRLIINNTIFKMDKLLIYPEKIDGKITEKSAKTRPEIQLKHQEC